MTDNYAKRRNVLTKKDKLALSKWAAQPSRDAPIDRAKLWEAINDYVNQHGGRIISPMHYYPLRVELPPESTLPDKFRKIGYTVDFRCKESRVGGPASPEYAARWRRRWPSPGYGFYTVEVFEINPPLPAPVTGRSNIAVQ
jgi:hypothetical protein